MERLGQSFKVSRRNSRPCVAEIPGAAGGTLRVEGDLHRTGTDSGGTWGTIEHGEIGGRGITRGR